MDQNREYRTGAIRVRVIELWQRSQGNSIAKDSLDYFSVIRNSKKPMHATTWINIKNVKYYKKLETKIFILYAFMHTSKLV